MIKGLFKMKIAIASSNGENVDLHLGKAYSLYVYEYDDEGITLLEHRILELEDDKHQGGKVIQACEDCDVIISVKYGFKSKIKADDAKIKLVSDEGPIDEVLKRYIDHYNFMRS